MKLNFTRWDTSTQRICVWAAADPHAIHRESLHPWKKKVWYALPHSHPHKWPIFFHTTVNADIYFNSFQESTSHVDDWELPFGIFKKMGQHITHLSGPWKKSRVSLGIGLS
jgi:hypothetical protein